MTDIAFASAAVFLAVGAAVLWVGSGVLRRSEAASLRLAMYTPDALRDETLRQPLSQRAVAPLVLAVGRSS